MSSQAVSSIGKGLGRMAAFDERDFSFPLTAVVPQIPNRPFKYHNASGFWSDQGNFPHCVAHAWLHFLESGPITAPADGPHIDTVELYHAAQKVDEWPGENYDGTSIRAGAKILQERGEIISYHWGHDVDALVAAVFQQPVPVGTVWTQMMNYPDEKTGIIRVDGNVEGGHAYLIDGVNVDKKLFRIKNSWGRSWGRKGFAFVSFDDMDKLIKDYGEICFAIEAEREIAA